MKFVCNLNRVRRIQYAMHREFVNQINLFLFKLASPTCHDHIMLTSKMDNFLIDGVDLEFNCTFQYFPPPKNFTWHLPNNTTAKTV